MFPTNKNGGGSGDAEDEGGEQLRKLLEKEKKVLTKKYETRQYQMFLYQKAMEGNVIICLPTGAGKTFVAIKVAQALYPIAKQHNKKIILITPTVPLTHQQGGYMESHLGENINIITGDQKPQDWLGKKWKEILNSSVAFSMTAKVLDDAITHGFILWEEIELLILDECHNAVGDSPMANLMYAYREAKKSGSTEDKLPQILGLSATIVIGNPKNKEDVEKTISLIESKFCSKAITYYNQEDVLKCATSATVEILSFEPQSSWPIDIGFLNSDLGQVCDDLELRLKEMDNFSCNKKTFKPLPSVRNKSLHHKSQLFNQGVGDGQKHSKCAKKIKEILHEMGPFCAMNALLYYTMFGRYTMEREEKIRKNPNDSTHVESILGFLESEMQLIFRQLEWYMKMRFEFDEERVLTFITPKVQKLVGILEPWSPQKGCHKNLCGIVFCKTRMITRMVAYYIQDLARLLPEKFGFLKCSFVLGTAGNTNETTLKVALKKQQEILQSFRDKKINLLIATNVLEEGLDVPSCNVIVRFDRIETFPSYIQSMGRAREKRALFYALLSTEDNQDQKSKAQYAKFQQFSKVLNHTLVQNATMSDKFYNFDDVNLEDENDLNSKVPPFKPLNQQAYITANVATETVYRYCSQLSSDKLTALSPIPWSTKAENLYMVHVEMPSNSCVKFGESGWFEEREVAKKAAFLDVCKKLFYAGALYAETLLPIPPLVLHNLSNFIDKLEGPGSSNIMRSGKKIGSKNSVLWYPKKCPEEFLTPKSTSDFKVYAIQVKREAYFGPVENEKLSDFEKSQHLYGIVTKADLNMVPDFMLFSKEGNFKVHLEDVTRYLIDEHDLPAHLNTSILKSLKIFQNLLFTKDPILLNLKHPVLKDADSSFYYIAPLIFKGDHKFQIALELIDKIESAQMINYQKMIQPQERSSDCSTFTSGSLVVPCYTQGEESYPKAYCVLSVENNKSPRSLITGKEIDYVEHFESKYQIQIINPNSPLLRAKAIGKQLNFLASPFNETSKAKKATNEPLTSSAIDLIPELVRIHPLPATLYVQLKMIPSCVHRIQRLLLAREIQASVTASFPNMSRRASLEQIILEKELKEQNTVVAEYAQKVLSSTKTTNASSNVNNLDSIVRPSQMPSRKRKFWEEIQYIHPKLMKMEDIRDCGYIEDLEFVRTIDIQQKVSVPSKQSVPCQNFDKYEQPKQPLVTSIMEAITLANGCDFVNLERLEIIGDSVLKLVATLHIFTHFPKDGEGVLTAMRTRLISNKHLLNAVATKKNLGQILSGGLFQPQYAFMPPVKTIPENLIQLAIENNVTYSVFQKLVNEKEETNLSNLTQDELKDFLSKHKTSETSYEKNKRTTYTHSYLGDKSLADCVESLIGSYYNSGGLAGALCFMEWAGLRGPVKPEKGGQHAEDKVYQAIQHLPRVISEYPPYQQKRIPLDVIRTLETLIGYKFKNQWLVVEAFTHPTAPKALSSYQRLEFVGDAVIDYVITHYIYKNPRIKDAGQLTDLRAALVNNCTFGSITIRYKFHKYPLFSYFSPELEDAIQKFEKCQMSNGNRVSASYQLLMGEEDCIISNDVEVPKALGDVFEALVGAVFVDSGMSLDTAWSVVYRLMKQEIEEFSENIPLQPMRQLHEKYPNRIKISSVRDYTNSENRKIVRLDVNGIKSTFFGRGKTKKTAKEAAAKWALKKIPEILMENMKQ